MRQKITFKKVLEDFKFHYPTLAKKVAYWRPNNFSQILVLLDDGMQLLYDYENHRATICRKAWEKT